MDNTQLTPIVLHELAHIQRKDMWIGVLQEAIAIVFWWSPVMRLINRKIHINRELACDLRAAKKLSNGKQYAQSLLDCTKLMLSEHKNLHLAKLLYQNGADVNAIVKHDETPLINASRQNDYPMVEFLVENGADVNLGVNVLIYRDGEKTTQYRSPLNMTKSSKIRDYLLSKGAQI